MRKVQCEKLIEKALVQQDNARIKKLEMKRAREAKAAELDGINNDTSEDDSNDAGMADEGETEVHRPRRRGPAHRRSV
jgi:hypothetical protein